MKKTLKRRRKENKTDYLKRFKLLKSELPRIVFRRSNKYILSQYVKSNESRDKILFSADSKELLKYGWPEKSKGSLKSITASYLTGYLIGKKIIKNKSEKPILDIGMIQALRKSKVFGFLKGVIDAGVNINCDNEAFPGESRIKGESLKNKVPFEEIKSKIESKNA